MPSDLAQITSAADAEALAKRGLLEKLYLVPREFGGQDIPDNRVFVPIGVAAAKAGIDLNLIRPVVADGKDVNYEVNVNYDGPSVVPVSIEIVASGPIDLRTTIRIWGKGLDEDLEDAGA